MVAKGRLSIGLTRPVISRDTSGLQTLLLRAEPLCAVVPPAHPLASRASVPWQALASEPLIILARREGVSLHDEVLAGCRKAGFTPRIAQTPSLIGTVLSYVEAGAGIGIVTDSVALNPEGAALKRINLQPEQSVPLVMVWPEQESDPPMRAFRELVKEWIKAKKLWPVK
jgi:DNA-binding transcriptional LysR family regulator